MLCSCDSFSPIGNSFTRPALISLPSLDTAPASSFWLSLETLEEMLPALTTWVHVSGLEKVFVHAVPLLRPHKNVRKHVATCSILLLLLVLSSVSGTSVKTLQSLRASLHEIHNDLHALTPHKTPTFEGHPVLATQPHTAQPFPVSVPTTHEAPTAQAAFLGGMAVEAALTSMRGQSECHPKAGAAFCLC